MNLIVQSLVNHHFQEKYGDKVRASRAQRENMQAFFDKVKAGDEGTNNKLNEVCKASPWVIFNVKAFCLFDELTESDP